VGGALAAPLQPGRRDVSARRLEIRVVDATDGAIAEGLRVDVYCLGEHAVKLCSSEVGAGGIVEDPVLASEAIVPGEYEVVFHVGEFFRRRGLSSPPIPFIDAVPFRFGIASNREPCHLPVRISPWGFAVGQDCR
jgi:5-hydroxyisourate hydrolase